MIIIDTNVFYSFYNSSDRDHEIAREIFTKILDGLYGKPILLDYVFDELITLIQTRRNNKSATQIGSIIMNDTEDVLELMQLSYPIFQSAWALFQNQKGRKFLSFTDCAIIECARTFKINNIASFESLFKSFSDIEIIDN
jgi:predicted nucleic acid-binding protein